MEMTSYYKFLYQLEPKNYCMLLIYDNCFVVVWATHESLKTRLTDGASVEMHTQLLVYQVFCPIGTLWSQ